MAQKRIIAIACLLVWVPLVTAWLDGARCGPEVCLQDAALSCSPMRITICPWPGCEPVSEGCGGTSDYIEIWVYDQWGIPQSGVPWSDYWIQPCDDSQDLLICVEGFLADSLTSSLPGFEGRTTISGRIKGGGCVLSGGLLLIAQGRPVYEDEMCITLLCLDVALVSPDINSDGQVSLGDFGIFCDSYGLCQGETGYNDCCDYTDDGCCSLEDFSVFVGCYQRVCM